MFQLLPSAASPGHRLSQAVASQRLLLLVDLENVSDLHERPLSQTLEKFLLPVGSQDGSIHEKSVFVTSQIFHSNDTPEESLNIS